MALAPRRELRVLQNVCDADVELRHQRLEQLLVDGEDVREVAIDRADRHIGFGGDAAGGDGVDGGGSQQTFGRRQNTADPVARTLLHRRRAPFQSLGQRGGGLLRRARGH
ncbi:hypothetical protein D3C81_1894720 [compost metagenome]